MEPGIIFVIAIIAFFVINTLSSVYIKNKIVNEITIELKKGNTDKLKELIFSNKAKRNLNKAVLLSLQINSLCLDKKYDAAKDLLEKTDYSKWSLNDRLNTLSSKLNLAYQMENNDFVSNTIDELKELSSANSDIKKIADNIVLDAEISYKLNQKFDPSVIDTIKKAMNNADENTTNNLELLLLDAYKKANKTEELKQHSKELLNSEKDDSFKQLVRKLVGNDC